MFRAMQALPRQGSCRAIFIAAAVLGSAAAGARGANQTAALSDVIVNGSLPMQVSIGASVSFGSATLPALHSFSHAEYFDPTVGHSRWLVIGGLTNGLHDLGGAGFDPASQNGDVVVIDPITKQVWSRSLTDPSSGLTDAQVRSLSKTNAQSTQIGSRLYIAGGYGPNTLPNGDVEYSTADTLSSIDLPGMIDWVRTGNGTAAGRLRQISDPTFQVTGGAMATSPSTGLTHLVFGQNYPSSYEPRQNGAYTYQVRSFNIVDDANGLSVTNVVAHAQQNDFRRRDLNVVPTIHKDGSATADGLQALSGVFTPSFGVWTAPVNIDANGNATEADPAASSTFKQGMNGYKCASLGLYSASSGRMHTLLLGGISYETYDPTLNGGSGAFQTDVNLPFTSNATDVVTHADGSMTQYLLSNTFPDILSPNTGLPLLLGAETEFFPADGVPTYANGVINLDALVGPTVVGWLYGGIAAEQPNNGATFGSNAVFPVIISPVPEPTFAAMGITTLLLTGRGRRRSNTLLHL